MPPKKTKQKPAKQETVVDLPEHASLDNEQLKERMSTLNAQLQKAQVDRNYVQLEKVSDIE